MSWRGEYCRNGEKSSTGDQDRRMNDHFDPSRNPNFSRSIDGQSQPVHRSENSVRSVHSDPYQVNPHAAVPVQYHVANYGHFVHPHALSTQYVFHHSNRAPPSWSHPHHQHRPGTVYEYSARHAPTSNNSSMSFQQYNSAPQSSQRGVVPKDQFRPATHRPVYLKPLAREENEESVPLPGEESKVSRVESPEAEREPISDPATSKQAPVLVPRNDVQRPLGGSNDKDKSVPRRVCDEGSGPDTIAIAALLGLTNCPLPQDENRPKTDDDLNNKIHSSIPILPIPGKVSPELSTDSLNSSLQHPGRYDKSEESTIKERNKEIIESPKVSEARCKCKNSRCLKLYCVCFQNGDVCSRDCGCTSCANNIENSTEYGDRTTAIRRIILRKLDSFHPITKKRSREGCSCKRSRCLLKYCECFSGGIFCTGGCSCKNCENHQNGRVAEFLKRQAKDQKLDHRKFKNEATKQKGVSQEVGAPLKTELSYLATEFVNNF